MSTTINKKKNKRKPRVRIDRILICICVLALILACTIYSISYRNKTKIDIPIQESFQSIRASLTHDIVNSTPVEDNPISLDYPTNYLVNLTDDDISAEYVYVLDKTNGQILFDKNSTQTCYPASTTKILTAVVAIEYVNLDTIFTVGNEINFVEEGSSLAYLVQGEQISFRDLLYGLMLPSGNDAGYTIAVNVARIVSGNPLLTDNEAVQYFVNMMNKKAKSLGMEDSNFVVPDGYHNKNHYVTAQDMMRLLIYAKNIDILNEVTSTQSYDTTAYSGELHQWINTNKLLDEDSLYYYQGVTGFKTGFHDYAGNCLIVTTDINGREIYMIIMKSETDTSRYKDATLLLDSIYSTNDI